MFACNTVYVYNINLQESGTDVLSSELNIPSTGEKKSQGIRILSFGML